MLDMSFEIFSGLEYEFSVNLCVEDMLDLATSFYIYSKLDAYRGRAKVAFEILESELKNIKWLGGKISIDDFGTEHSNFRRLLELEVDLIKIDGSFIKNLDKCETSQKMVRSIISFAKSIGAMTAAEFVHSKEIKSIIKDIGVDYSQGYYIGIPNPKPKIIHYEAFD